MSETLTLRKIGPDDAPVTSNDYWVEYELNDDKVGDFYRAVNQSQVTQEPKWEYNVVTVERAGEVRTPGDPAFKAYILDRLQYLGLEGWEVCAYCLGFLIVKRRRDGD